MEMMRHPEETTSMRRQTVSSYFRVGVFYFVLMFIPSFHDIDKPNMLLARLAGAAVQDPCWLCYFCLVLQKSG